MRLKSFLLAVLLVASTASRAASGHPQSTTPDPEPKAKEKKKIVVVSPEKKIVVDGDEVLVSGEDEAEVFADLGDLANLGDFPEFAFFEGGGYIGIRPIEMTPDLREHFGAPKE